MHFDGWECEKEVLCAQECGLTHFNSSPSLSFSLGLQT